MLKYKQPRLLQNTGDPAKLNFSLSDDQSQPYFVDANISIHLKHHTYLLASLSKSL